MSNLPPDVVKFLKENTPPPIIEPTDLTRYTAAEIWGCSESAADYRLNKLVGEGKLEKIVKLSPSGAGSRTVNTYVPKKSGDKQPKN